MSLHADTLFSYDNRGRMVCTNGPEGRPAPRLFLGYTRGGYTVRFSEAVPRALARRLTEIIDHQPAVDTLHLRPPVLDMVREALERQAPVMREVRGPAYRFPETIAQSGEAVRVTDANIEVTFDTYPWLVHGLAACEPCFAMIRDGAAVSVCFSSRIGAAASEAGVDTLLAFRGRGCATAVTAAWGASVRDDGRIPLYSTAWDNLGSQGVARRLGLTMFGADVSWD